MGRFVRSARLAPRQRFRAILQWVIAPSVIYFAALAVYSWPWVGRFNTHFFANDGDGLQNVWNNWWINRAVTQLHQSPWHTNVLHFPHGTTLLGQTMNPFNGFVGIVLMKVFTIVQVYNLMVIFSFVMGGLTACWLCRSVTHQYVPSVIGGFVFTFSAYHTASAMGFMQLVSLEWIPLFILLWWKLLTRPTYANAVGSAAALFLVLMCDYYYFLYSSAAALVIAIYLWRRREVRRSRPMIVFGVLAAALCIPLPILLLRTNAHDKLLGYHSARVYSTDLFSTFIDGGAWRFAPITNWYWNNIHSPLSSSSVYIGVVVIVAFVVVAIRRGSIHSHARFWLTFTTLFWVMSLGPRLLAVGKSVKQAPLPYAILEHFIPPLKLGGMPYRTMVMVTLGGAVLVAMLLSRFDLQLRKGQLLLVLFCVALVVEMWPAQMPSARAAHPPYVDALKSLPNTGGVIDDAAPSAPWQLYYQTVHEKPIAEGYISRIPTSVFAKDNVIVHDVAHGRFDRLCRDFHIRYYTTLPTHPIVQATFPVVYRGTDALIYDLKTTSVC